MTDTTPEAYIGTSSIRRSGMCICSFVNWARTAVFALTQSNSSPAMPIPGMK